MVATVQNHTTYSSFPQVKDDMLGVDDLLDFLTDPRLAQWIAEAAQLATAQHLTQEAQKMRSAVESENSTK